CCTRAVSRRACRARSRTSRRRRGGARRDRARFRVRHLRRLHGADVRPMAPGRVMRAYLFAAVAAAAIALVWLAYAQGKDAGRAACEARVAAAAAAAREDERKRDAIAAQVGMDMLDFLSRMAEQQETVTHET